MTETLSFEKFIDGVIVRFSNPKTRNPISTEVLNQLRLFLNDFKSTSEKIIFTGTDDIFASGADLREIAEIKGEAARNFALQAQEIFNKIARLNSFAAVNGICYGGAFDLAMACKWRFAAPQARFRHPGASLGIMTGWGGTQRMPRLTGEAFALEIFLTGREVSASEAFEAGLIHKIVDNPEAEAMAFEG
ncbi:MAG TPA: enoyl-CoA hydratase/isomerase family protein [Pyrinomonadaceae bacterium]|nr:enoyl-CoA hydratase/isomerase family protein [Pyrinomonadaceae bacterium]